MTDTTAVSTDPEAHSIHLDDPHVPITIEPADPGDHCNICYRRYEDGEWRLRLPEARNRRDQTLNMHTTCAQKIGAAVGKVPAGPAPWVDYSS